VIATVLGLYHLLVSIPTPVCSPRGTAPNVRQSRLYRHVAVNPRWFGGSLCAAWRDWYTRRFQNSDWKDDCGMAADPSQAQPAPSGSYRALTVVLRVFAAFAVITGLLDVVTGLRLLVSSGAHLPAAAVIDPVLNSHIKYMGAVWAGFGVALWWTTHDLVH